MLNVKSHILSIYKIYTLCRKERFDVLHVHTPIAAVLGRIAGKLAGVPIIIYTAHGFYFHEGMPRWKYRIFVGLERTCGRITDYLFTQSSEDAKTAVAEGIAQNSRALAIGNGVNTRIFSPSAEVRATIRADLGFANGDFVVGVIARLVKEKGLGEFLEAATIVGERFPQARFLLVGERLASDHNASIEVELARAKAVLGPRLIALGYRADVADLLNAMDAFCLPSYREGMPRSIIEAMMIALPVIATNIRGSREEVIDGETGILVPTKSVSALASAMEAFVSSPTTARRMGAAGRQRALDLYDEDRVIERQLRMIESLSLSSSRMRTTLVSAD
jgi:glycosyltransferase involved in cell wall biosynthesis